MAVSTVDIYPSGPLIAMLGNPNAGKTSLFNILTGSKQKVANYAGVTVERVEGQLIGAPEKIRVLDLPGTYSFHPRSPDEKVTVDVLKGIARGERRPDLVVCVLDATNLRRGLKLVMAAQRLKLPAVVAVNMMDLARRRGIELKAEDLSRELGVPVVETIAVRKQGIDRLTELLSDPSAWSSWVPEATEEDDLARLNRILRKLGLDKIFPDEFSDRIDRVVLNPWLGVTILMIILFFVFQAVFAWSAYPMEWIEEGFNMLGELCAEHLPDGFVKDLLVDAVSVEFAKTNKAVLEGLEYRVKSPKSLYNKLYQRVEKSFFDSLADVVRYTIILDPEDYVEQIRSVITALSEKNWKIYALKNYWTNDGFPYNGVNTKFKNPRNYRIEIQFHTKESFDVKMSKEDHDLYEQRRVLEPGCDEYNRILQLQLNLYSNMEYPKNIALLDNI